MFLQTVLPSLVIVGRPNVGKSTLFNRLTRSRAALVHDLAGITRDRHYARAYFAPTKQETKNGDVPAASSFLVVDTGGFEPFAKEGISMQMARQTQLAIDEADVLLMIVDARSGLQTADEEIYQRLRRLSKPLFVLINKSEGMQPEITKAEFHELGATQLMTISSAHGNGISNMLTQVVKHLPSEQDLQENSEPASKSVARITVVGRPNVGKTTLINKLLGEERLIAFDQPGTTRDAIAVPFQRGNQTYTLIDTAGLRRRGKVFASIEKFSVVKTLQAISAANVVILVLDSSQDISDQDAHIAGFCLENGRAIVVAINKWDAVDAYQRQRVKEAVAHKLAFLNFARVCPISALKGQGIKQLLQSTDQAWQAAMINLLTPRVSRVMQEAVRKHAPPRTGQHRPKLRYAHQGGKNPPLIIVHGNNLDQLPASYLRYLEHSFSQAFNIRGTPLQVQVKVNKT